MGLTIFVDEKHPTVGIIEWLKDPRFSISYPSKALLLMPLDEFRNRGVDLVRTHFEEYQRATLDEKDAHPVFEGIDAKKYLRQQQPLDISRNYATRETIISPLRFRSYSLGGLQSLGKELQRKLKADYSPQEFWDAFDAALAELS